MDTTFVVIPKKAICPISFCLMADPVRCADGCSYERDAIEHWFALGRSSPVTKTMFVHKTLVPNIALRNLILDLEKRLPIQQREHLHQQRRDCNIEVAVARLIAEHRRVPEHMTWRCGTANAYMTDTNIIDRAVDLSRDYSGANDPGSHRDYGNDALSAQHCHDLHGAERRRAILSAKQCSVAAPWFVPGRVCPTLLERRDFTDFDHNRHVHRGFGPAKLWGSNVELGKKPACA